MLSKVKNSLKILSVFLALLLIFTASVKAAAPDGSGPWADEVVSSSQGTMKNGSAVSANRSNPTSALGIAEETDAEGTFFSLGFGGSIILKFDNGIADGVFVVESTHTQYFYPIESAQVDISEDGTNWFSAGRVARDSEVDQPDEGD